MPSKIVFLRHQNWSCLNPITKALLPPSRDNDYSFGGRLEVNCHYSYSFFLQEKNTVTGNHCPHATCSFRYWFAQHGVPSPHMIPTHLMAM